MGKKSIRQKGLLQLLVGEIACGTGVRGQPQVLMMETFRNPDVRSCGQKLMSGRWELTWVEIRARRCPFL